MQDPVVGTWIPNVEKSEFDAHRRPERAPWSSNLTPKDSIYRRRRESNEKSKECMERPVRFIPDGKPHPIPDLIGLKYDATKTEPNTMTREVTKEDGLERFGTKAPYESPTTRTLPP